MRVVLLAAGAVAAFAGNSLLCRYALESGAIDPATFTLVRLVSGALALYVICRATRRAGVASDLVSAASLLVYALAFAYAYVGLGAATGALILFATVQATMLGTAVVAGARPSLGVWTGIVLACVGIVALVAPHVASPPMVESVLMALAGAAWAIYSLRGQQGGEPVAATLGNFVAAALGMIPLWLIAATDAVATPGGLLLGVLSGALTSGLGYVLWYAVLPDLGAVRAASAQLVVPALAALGGVVILDEPFTPRLAASTALIIGGVALAQRRRRTGAPTTAGMRGAK